MIFAVVIKTGIQEWFQNLASMSTKLIQMTMGAHYKEKGSRCRELSRYVFLLMIRILQSEIRIIENKEEKKRFHKSLVS